jgi:hypothetical protein
MNKQRGFFVIAALTLGSISTFAAIQTRQVTLESKGDGRVYRSVNHNGRVRLVRQLSDKPCREGRTWGYDRNGIWVDDGCRAIFSYESDDRRGDSRNDGIGIGRIRLEDIFRPSGSSSYNTTRFKLESDGGRERKRIDTSGGVRLLRQISGTRCIQNRTWGYDRDEVWVDDGCRAEFEVRTRRDGRNDRDTWGDLLPGRGVPNWAVGRWNGIRNADDLDLRIESNGNVTIARREAWSDGRRGEIRGSRMLLGEQTFEIKRDGANGIILTPIRAFSGALHFRRDR